MKNIWTDLARYSKGDTPNFVDLERYCGRAFSNFKFLIEKDWAIRSMSRLFSLARSHNCKTAIVEIISQENARGALKSEINKLALEGISNEKLIRISFWDKQIKNVKQLEKQISRNLKGYLIYKEDNSQDGSIEKHIFEAVFSKYNHMHNFVPRKAQFFVRIGTRKFNLDGIMYCQQNEQNKGCAHVALRSLLCLRDSKRDFSFEEIHKNSRARKSPSHGLSSRGIRQVLDKYLIPYVDLDYGTKRNPLREKMPYSKMLYAGVENGFGSLVGFRLEGPQVASGSCHIIPFYGHTFNSDNWAPRAGNAYFRVGSQTRYFSSEEWVSSFIGHDDNFGPNFCVPRNFLKKEQVQYVVTLLPYKVIMNPIQAELTALAALEKTFISLMQSPKTIQTFWLRELLEYVFNKDVVLRTLYVSKKQYLKHLKKIKDADGIKETTDVLEGLNEILPDQMWMIEVSIPEIFATNYSKLGEILLDPFVEFSPNDGYLEEALLLARLPGNYYFKHNISKLFDVLASVMKRHTRVFRME